MHVNAIWPMMSATMASPSSPRGAERSLYERRSPSVTGMARHPLMALVLALAVSLVGGMVHAVEPNEEESLALDAGLIAEALEVLDDRFVDEAVLTEENLTTGAIRGLVEALGDDGHTEYLTPEEYQVSLDMLDGRVVGIGVVLDHRSSQPLIISVVDGSPADRAGLRAGDVIASVDGKDTARLPEGALADLVRGTAGTTVRLGIERSGEPRPLEFGIARADVDVDPASWARVPGTSVALVRIVQFSVAAGPLTREAVEAALEAEASGIVLDLRGNPGGLVHEALDVAATFLDGGVAYLEKAREGPPTEVAISAGRALAPDVPLVVLVDYGTASSAEILAAALRDNERASLVGEQTFGTGTILNTFGLSDGSALRVGVLSWLTPGGKAVHRVGLSPDHEVELAPGSLALRPADLVAMTAIDLVNSDDVPLRFAVDLISPLAAP